MNIKMMNQGIHFQDKNKYSLGQTFDQGNNQFQFAGVDTDKQNAAMYFYVTKNTIDPLAPLTTVVVTKKTHSGSDFHTQLKQIADDYYVVRFKKSAISNGRLFVKLGSKKEAPML